MIRIIVKPRANGRWSAETEDGVDLVETTSQPFFDGARALLANGTDQDELVTMRHFGAAHDSFVPVKLRDAAHWTTTSEKVHTIGVRKWQAYDGPEWSAR